MSNRRKRRTERWRAGRRRAEARRSAAPALAPADATAPGVWCVGSVLAAPIGQPRSSADAAPPAAPTAPPVTSPGGSSAFSPLQPRPRKAGATESIAFETATWARFSDSTVAIEWEMFLVLEPLYGRLGNRETVGRITSGRNLQNEFSGLLKMFYRYWGSSREIEGERK